jgi:hypothetical protein
MASTYCKIKDVFYTCCRAKHNLILTNYEMIIWKIALYLNTHGGFSEYNITDMLLTAIRKSRVYPILILKTYATEAFKHAILTNPYAGNSNRYLSKNSILQYTHCVFLSLKIILWRGLKPPLQFNAFSVVKMNSAIFGPSYSVTTLSMYGLVSIACLKASVAYVFKIKIGYTLDLRIAVNNIISCSKVRRLF